MKRELDSLVIQMHSAGISYADAVRQFKRRYILEVLANNKGNQCKAADELGRPVVVKPVNGRQGYAVSLEVETAEELKVAFRAAKEFSSAVLIEEMPPERAFRRLPPRPVERPRRFGKRMVPAMPPP